MLTSTKKYVLGKSVRRRTFVSVHTVTVDTQMGTIWFGNVL